MHIGSARPAISHLMTDTLDGNRVREYPQALLKQFDNINPHPEYSGQDIIAMVKKEKETCIKTRVYVADNAVYQVQFGC